MLIVKPKTTIKQAVQLLALNLLMPNRVHTIENCRVATQLSDKK